MYTAVVLDQHSYKIINEQVNDPHFADWEILAHHVTLRLGAPTKTDAELMGKLVNITIDGWGENNKVAAFRVAHMETSDEVKVESVNPIPHVTFAVNRTNGGKPKQSNDLDFKPCKSFQISGYVQSCI